MLIVLIILILVIAVAVVLLGVLVYMLNQTNKRLNIYASGLQDSVRLQAEKYEESLSERDNLLKQVEHVTWERDAAHMLIQHLMPNVPEDAKLKLHNFDDEEEKDI